MSSMSCNPGPEDYDSYGLIEIDGLMLWRHILCYYKMYEVFENVTFLDEG